MNTQGNFRSCSICSCSLKYAYKCHATNILKGTVVGRNENWSFARNINIPDSVQLYHRFWPSNWRVFKKLLLNKYQNAKEVTAIMPILYYIPATKLKFITENSAFWFSVHALQLSQSTFDLTFFNSNLYEMPVPSAKIWRSLLNAVVFFLQ